MTLLLYPDDTSTLCCEDDPEDIVQHIENNINDLKRWFKNNRLKLRKKTKKFKSCYQDDVISINIEEATIISEKM